MTVTESAFKKFDSENPKVWELFSEYTFEAIKAGHKRIGAKMVAERIRWESFVATKGDAYKFNNNYTAFYARKFSNTFPLYKEVFRNRTSVADKMITNLSGDRYY